MRWTRRPGADILHDPHARCEIVYYFEALAHESVCTVEVAHATCLGLGVLGTRWRAPDDIEMAWWVGGLVVPDHDVNDMRGLELLEEVDCDCLIRGVEALDALGEGLRAGEELECAHLRMIKVGGCPL